MVGRSAAKRVSELADDFAEDLVLWDNGIWLASDLHAHVIECLLDLGGRRHAPELLCQFLDCLIEDIILWDDVAWTVFYHEFL